MKPSGPARCEQKLSLFQHTWLPCAEALPHRTCGTWMTTHDAEGRETTVRITWLAGERTAEKGGEG